MLRDGDYPGIDPAFLDRVTTIVAEVDSVDFQLVDPPDELWGLIAVSIAADRDSTPTGSGSVVEYAIDANDIVIAVDAGWAAFAQENDAPELAELATDRPLSSYFDSDEVRDVWRLLIERVRAKQTQAHVPLRCDAPDMRRWFEMTITPEPHDVLRFRSVLVFEEPRSSVALLSPNAVRDDTAPGVPVCSWCGDGYDGSQWQQIEELVRNLRLLEERVPPINHGICPTCRDLMSSDLLVRAKSYDDPR